MGLVGYNLGGKRYSEGKLGVWVLGWLIGEGYHSKYRQEVRKIRKRDRSQPKIKGRGERYTQLEQRTMKDAYP